MGVLNPNVKRKKEGERGTIKIGAQPDAPLFPVPQRAAARAAERKMHAVQECEQEEEEEATPPKISEGDEEEEAVHEVSAAAAEEETAWAAAEKAYSDSIIDVIVREVKRRKGDHCAGISPHKADTIRANVHSWVTAARKQRGCAGTEESNQHAGHGLCAGKFHPWTFFSKGVVEFAHWKAHKRNNDPSQLIRNRCRADDNHVFVKWMVQKGRFLYICCHAIESAKDSRK